MDDYDESMFKFFNGWIISLLIVYFSVLGILITGNWFSLYEAVFYSVIPAAIFSPIFGILYAIREIINN